MNGEEPELDAVKVWLSQGSTHPVASGSSHQVRSTLEAVGNG